MNRELYKQFVTIENSYYQRYVRLHNIEYGAVGLTCHQMRSNREACPMQTCCKAITDINNQFNQIDKTSFICILHLQRTAFYNKGIKTKFNFLVGASELGSLWFHDPMQLDSITNNSPSLFFPSVRINKHNPKFSNSPIQL